MIHIVPYTDSLKSDWDDFVRKSKNGTFLFLRDYMDYHRDRFHDASLLLYDQRQRLVALFPADKKGHILRSHGGLTFGGLLLGPDTSAEETLQLLQAILNNARQQRFSTILYKAIPYIYHRLPSQEDLYALFRCQAKLYRRDISTTVTPAHPAKMQKRRVRGARKAVQAGIVCKESTDLAQYWDILTWNLKTIHKTQPVHTLAEIQSLHQSFPQNIRLFAAFLQGEMVAGTLIYESHRVAHAQYIANSVIGREKHALDALFKYLIEQVYPHKDFFDFGISTENNGQFLNMGLIAFKEGFGGRAVVYDAYTISL